MKLVRILVGVVAFLGLANVFMPGASSAPDKVVTIGYQKYGNLILLKGRGGIESRLAPLGFRVAWKEFPSGPPLLEALNAGAVDFGLGVPVGVDLLFHSPASISGLARGERRTALPLLEAYWAVAPGTSASIRCPANGTPSPVTMS